MNALAEAFLEQADSEIARTAGRIVDWAIFPFHSGKINVYTWYDVTYLNHKLKVTVECLPENDFAFTLNHRELVAYPDRYMDKFYSALFKHYRYRRTLPVEDHILLGEE